MENGKQGLENPDGTQKDQNKMNSEADANEIGNGQRPTGNTGSDTTVPASDHNGPTQHPEEQSTEPADQNKSEKPYHDIKGVSDSKDEALDAQAKKEEKGGYGNMQNPRDTDI